MKHTVVGIVATEHGVAYNPLERTRAWSTRSSEVRDEQAPKIPVDRDHTHQWCGEIVYLERHAGNLWAVAEVDTEPTVAVGVGRDTVHVETPLYWSAERVSTPDDRDILLRSVAITRTPARVAAQPLTWYEGGLDRRSGWVLDHHFERGLIARAGEARHTRHGRPLIIHDQQPGLIQDPWARADQPEASRETSEERAGQLMLRSAETLDVSEAGRTIDLIVVPYNAATRVPYDGKMVTETFAPTAFDGIERQTNKVRANRDHDLQRTVGVAAWFDPRDQRGLRAEVQIARTDLGDETLALAASDCLDASAAFRPLTGGMSWRGRSSYTITKAWLGHIGLTPDPAYEGARVLDVRDAGHLTG